MEFVLIPLVALGVSGLTLFSGFGLGTLLMPVFAIFFPVELAVAMTAVIHFLNNLFKLALLGRHADRSAVLRFGVPAILMAIVGAWLLLWLSGLDPLYTYEFGTRELSVTPVKLTVSVLMVGFAMLELVPRFSRLSFDRRYLPLGGTLSGFFGGLLRRALCTCRPWGQHPAARCHDAVCVRRRLHRQPADEEGDAEDHPDHRRCDAHRTGGRSWLRSDLVALPSVHVRSLHG